MFESVVGPAADVILDQAKKWPRALSSWVVMRMADLSASDATPRKFSHKLKSRELRARGGEFA